MFKKFHSVLLCSAAVFLTASCAAAPKTAPKTATTPAVKKKAVQKTAAQRAAEAAAREQAAFAAMRKKFPMPALENRQSWSMVIVPDMQTYIKQTENNGILDLMLAWIVRRRAELNIQQVLFTGDLVYYNDTNRLNRPDGVRFFRSGSLNDLVAEEQWKTLSRLMERLDGELPYILCTGNHDYGFRSAENKKTHFGKYFPTDRNKLTRRQLVACAFNKSGESTLENSAYEFTAPSPDNRKFLIITLQFAPTDAQLKWAKSIADQPRFADHIGIVLTHSYIYGNGKRIPKERYALNREGGNAGEDIFKKLIYPAKNIRMVVCGHVCKPDDWSASVGFSVDKNSAGKSVAQMVFNTQAIGGGFSGSGGDGWLRLLEFMPDRKTVKARTFSPFFGSSPSTFHLAWKKDARNCFSFTID